MAKYIIDIPDEVPVSDGLVPFDMCRPSWYWEAYEKGKAETEDEVWAFVKTLGSMDQYQRKEMFGDVAYWYVLDAFNYQQAKTRYEDWKAEKAEIHVGDEVNVAGTTGVVVRIPKGDEQRIHYIAPSGAVYCNNAYADIVKTGRHFPEVAELLKKMGEDSDEG